MAVVRQGSKTEIVLFSSPTTVTYVNNGMRVLWRDGAGPWMLSPHYPGVAHAASSLAVHPKLGSFIAWISRPPHEWSPRPVCGPYVMSGPSLDPLLVGSQPIKPLQPADLDGPAKVVVVPPEVKVPTSQGAPAELGPSVGAATVKECAQAIHDICDKPNGLSLMLTRYDPRFRNEHAKELPMAQAIEARLNNIAALAQANRLSTMPRRDVMFCAMHYDLLGDPIFRLALGNMTEWRGTTIKEDKDTAVLITPSEEVGGEFARVAGKWYLKSPYADPATRTNRQLILRRWPILLNGLELIEQRIRDGKVTGNTFSLEFDRLDRRLDKEVPMK